MYDTATEEVDRYRRLIDAMTDPVLIHCGGKIVFVNSATFTLGEKFGVDFVGRDVLSFIHPDDVDEIRQRIMKVLIERESSTPKVFRVVFPGQNLLYMEVSGMPVTWDGQPASQTICRDVTEAKIAADRLLESAQQNERLIAEKRFLLDNMSDFVYRKNVVGNIVYVSPGVERVTGYSVDEWKSNYNKILGIDHPPKQLEETHKRSFPTETDERAGLLSAAKFVSGSIHTFEFEIETPGGSVKFLEINERPVLRGGNYDGVIGVGRDVTQQVNAIREKQLLEERLRQQQKLESVGTLASGVAHEINNPIQAILNYAELIRRRVDNNSPAYDFADAITAQSQRVSGIVRNLLAFARNETGGMRSVRVADLIDDVLRLNAPVLKVENIDITQSIPGDLPQIYCKKQQIEQVLMNFLTNARDALGEKFGEEETEKFIRISCSKLERNGSNWVRIAVRDNGPGISADVLPRIFDPFFTTKQRNKGTGLGLSVSHGIVTDHNGEISVVSNKDIMTEFRLDLPAI